LPTPVSAALGLVFVLVGGAAVWLIFAASTRTRDQTARDRIIRAHRLAGYLFIALFCLMSWFMLLRLGETSDDLSLRSMLHVLIAMILAPLLVVKIVIARYYKGFTSALVPLGLTIFILGFVLVTSTTGPYLFRRIAVKSISLRSVDAGGNKLDLQSSEALMQRRCSRCHTLDRVVGARKDASGWLATVDRMRELPGSGISETEAKVILSYLSSENSIDSSSDHGELAVGKALVDSHCNRCHALDRIYAQTKSPSEWRETVMRMAKYAGGTDGFFNPGEEERIVRFLSRTQTPDAMQKRFSPALDLTRDERRSANRGESPKHFGAMSGAVTVLIAAVIVPLIWRRPKSGIPVAAEQSPAPLVKKANQSIILQLARIERQTHDCVSFRFRLQGVGSFRARPGQFLTFDWLVHGRKLARSYSISSSPTQSGFLEITVKKQAQGIVSTFLNESCSVGLTVEARGPFGRFCFDENEHKSIVLIAAGSGITPVMSILRYIEDLCLDTEATLFYSARTEQDIIFGPELERLEERLPHFRRFVVLTRPSSGWTGATGRLSGEFIMRRLAEVQKHTFFLCGPESFMEHVKAILLSSGVAEQRIIQESFGGRKIAAAPERKAEGALGVIEFVRSGRACSFSAGETLLEVAEINGIDIPSSCRQGQCGTCATRLVEGQIKMDCEEGLDGALKAQGYVLTCVARAQGNVRLDA
jgi:ferredoxin-NADP reductase/mono/diheme cytochrome c family protein